MKWFEERIKERFKNDPKGYAKYLKEEEEYKNKIEENNFEERKKASEIFLENTNTDITKKVRAMTKKEIMRHKNQVDYISSILKQIYSEKMDEDVYSRSTNTFKELLSRNKWEEIREKIISYYPKEKEGIDTYKKVYFELLNITPVENKDGMVIEVSRENDELGSSDGSNQTEFYDVSGLKKGDFWSYAIEFQPWEEWLGYYCNQEDLDSIGEPAFIAHAMWEMTFTGYSDEDVRRNAEELEEDLAEARETIGIEKEEE